MKKLITTTLMVLAVAIAMAQTPENFSFQAVVRNASNTLVINSQVGVRVNILQGSAMGDAVYSESHVTTTNANGLVTVSIGGGSVLHGSFAGIDWAGGPYFLKTDIDPNGGNDYSITTTQQLLSVPYALYAKEAGNGFSGDYNDLTNLPQIPQVPADISAFNNDAGYITMDSIPAIPTVPTNVSAFTNDAGYLTGYTETDPTVPAWAKEATKPTYNYSEIINTPTIPTVPTNVSAFNNDAGYLTGYTETDPQFNAWDKDYNDLTNKPTIPTIPANVSTFTNDANYVTTSQLNAANYITAAQVPAQVNADWNATSGKAQILNKPNLFSGNYNDLTNKPTIPTVPSNVSVFNNDAHYITEAQLNALLAAMNNTIDSLRNRIEELEGGGTPVTPEPGPSDTTVTPSVPGSVDGLACPGMATVTDYDGNVYNTVAIGQQCWMKENLRTSHYANGTAITLSTTASTTDPFRYNPGGNADNVNTYGFVYNWLAVMHGSLSSNANPSSVQGICPAGWHVPSNVEWSQMTGYVNSQNDFKCGGTAQYIAKALASTTLWSSNSINCAVGDYAPNNNATGFSALPAGDNSGTVGTNANFWSCTQSDNSTAYAIQLSATSPVVTVNPDAAKTNGFSVRCVRDIAIEGDVTQMVTTAAVSGITSTTAVCGGTVNSGNGSAVTARGVCWSVTQNPTVAGDHTTDGSGTGTFTSAMTGLQPGTTYYVRAYATNSAGTAYGYTQTFTTANDASACGTATISDYDGNVYNTVQIGDQCWMKENLRTTHYADGTYIPVGASDQTTIGYRWAPNCYDTTVINPYGYLYNWYAVMCGAPSSNTNPSGVRGICPLGWHVPSDAEWTQLTDYVSSQPQYQCGGVPQNIARALAAQTDWNTQSSSPYLTMPDCSPGKNLNANNATGFTALPAGYFHPVTPSICESGYRTSF